MVFSFAPDDDVAALVRAARGVAVQCGATASALGDVAAHAERLGGDLRRRGVAGTIALAPLRLPWGTQLDLVTIDRDAAPDAASGDAGRAMTPTTVDGVTRVRVPVPTAEARESLVNIAFARVVLARADDAVAALEVLDFAGVVLAYPRLVRSGDAITVVPVRDGAALRVVVIDALGHGDLAADSADSLMAFLAGTSRSRSIGDAMRAAHVARAAAPRGAALAAIDVGLADASGEFVGVGNVEAVALGATTRPVSRPGTIGLALPRIVTEPVHFAPGAGLAMLSDGFRLRWPAPVAAGVAGLPAAVLLGVILATAERRVDDASVLIIQRRQ